MDNQDVERPRSRWSTMRIGFGVVGGLGMLIASCWVGTVIAISVYQYINGPSVCDAAVYSDGRPRDPDLSLYHSGGSQVIGHFGGGPASDLILKGSEAFVKLGRELLRLDLSDPSHPERKNYYYFADEFSLLQVASDRPEAILAFGGSLWSVDLSDPLRSSLRNLYYTTADTLDVRIQDNLVYLHVRKCAYTDFSLQICREGLQVVDISGGEFVPRPTRCSQDLLGAAELFWTFPRLPASRPAHATMGQYTVTTTEASGIRVYEAEASGEMKEVGIYNPPTNFGEVLPVGQFAYVAEREGPLHVIDVSNPAEPKKVGEYSGHLDFTHLERGEGPILWALVEGGATYVVLDISSPTSPELIGSVVAGSTYRDLEAAAENVYLLEDEVGIHILDARKKEPSVLIELDRPGTAIDIDVEGNLLYVLVDIGREAGVVLAIDVTSPSSPELLGEIQLEDPRALAVSGKTLFLIDNRRLQFFDVSDLGSPVLIREREEPRVNGLSAVGDTLYLQQYSATIRVLDVSNPSDPRVLAAFGGMRSISGFEDDTPLLIIGQGASGMLILRPGSAN